jgi:ribosomal protein S18 acetylase RimI-like enzyme
MSCHTFSSAAFAEPDAFLRSPNDIWLVAEEDGVVLGQIYGQHLHHPEGKKTMLLYSLDVVEDARGRGVGRSLTVAFVAEARKMGCFEVWVATDESNKAAQATYRSAGGTRENDSQIMYSWNLPGS